MWKSLFREHILGRGLDYFVNELVGNIYVKDNIIEATVYGTEEYKVEIIKENEEIINLRCDCPYAATGYNCKHMAAVLFYLENSYNIVEVEDVEEDIGKIVEEAEVTIVKDFLIDILKDDETLLNRFKNKLQFDISPNDMKRYKNQINGIFRRYAGYHDFIDYKNAWGFISNLEEFLQNDIQAMLDNNQLKEAFELTNYIFIKVGNQDMDDSDGGTGEIANICLDIWKEILYKSDIRLKREIFKWFTEHLNGAVIDYMEDYIEKIIFDDFKEKEFLENKIVFLDDKISEYKKEENVWFGSYRLGQLVLRRIEILEIMQIDQNMIEEYCKENVDIDEIRKYYIDICIKKKDYDMAIKLLKEGKDKGKKWPGVLSGYSLKLKNLYKKTGKYELYEEELWALVLKYDAGDVELYKELKSIYTDKEWIKKREIVFSKLPPYSGIDKLYELEGLYDRLIESVLKSHGLFMVTEYERILKDIYPKELLTKYENTVNDMATNTSDRARYRDIVDILRRMKKYPNGKEKVSEIVSDWRTRYRNRPAMMDELNRL